MREFDDSKSGSLPQAVGSRSILYQGFRFGSVGLLATLSYAIASGVAHSLGALPYNANLTGYAFGIIVSYFGHFYWTFGKRSDHGQHFARFLIVALAGFFLSNAIMFIVLDLFGLSFLASVAAIAVITPFATWMSGRYWAFR